MSRWKVLNALVVLAGAVVTPMVLTRQSTVSGQVLSVSDRVEVTLDASELPEGVFRGSGDLRADMTVEELNASGIKPPPPPAYERPQSGGGGTDPAAFHAWAFAREHSNNGSYVGTHAGKSFDIVTGLGTGVCTGPLYVPTWLYLTFYDGQYGWIEQGLAHTCDGQRIFYGFAAKNFNYQAPTGTLEGGIWTYYNPVNSAHPNANGTWYLEQYRDGDTGAGCAWWGQKVHGVVRGTVNFGVCGIGTAYEVGLESYRDWGFNYGPGALQTHNFGLLWNGVPGSARWYSTADWDYTRVDYQMHGRFGTQDGYPWSDWVCAKQNHAISPPSC